MAEKRAEKKDEKLSLMRLKDGVDKVFKSNEYKERRQKWQRFLKEFTGDWWSHTTLDNFDSRVFVNFLFSTIQAAAPLLTDNRPIWNVISRLGFQQKMANLYSNALKYLWDITEMDLKSYQAVIDMLLYGTGIVKVGYDPDEDEISTEIIDPSTFVVAPGYTDEWKSPWCGTVTDVPYTWILTTYPDVAKTVKPHSKSGEEDSLSNTNEYELVNSDSVTVYELWIRDGSVEKYVETETSEEKGEDGKVTKGEKKVESFRKKYPNGRIVIFTEDGVLLEDKASPFRHGKPPYVKLTNYHIPHHFWGQGEADQIENLVRELNARVQDIVDHSRRHTKQNYVMRENAGFTQEQAKNAIASGDEVLVAKGDMPLRDLIAPIETPDINRVFMDMINVIPKFIEEITGVTDTTKGTPSKKSRQSAHEVNALLESSYTRTRQKVRNFERWTARLCSLHLDLMQQFYTEPRPIAYQEEGDNAVSTTTISNNPQHMLPQMQPDIEPGIAPEDMTPEEKQELQDFESMIQAFAGADEIYGDFIIQIETNSSLPMDHQSMANLALRLAEQGIIDPPAVMKILRLPYRHEVEQRMKAAQEAQMQTQGGGGPPGSGPNPPAPPVGGKGPDFMQAIAQMHQGGQ